MGLFSRAPKINTNEVLINALLTRGVENLIPRELAAKKLRSGERLRVYLGIDPTGAKLHLGHSVPLRKLQAFAELGHEVVFLVGSFTAMIGDPSGRDAMREPLTRKQIEENFKEYKRQAEKILDFSRVTIRYNHEWLEKVDFEKILELGSKFTVQQMLKRDMFEKRIKEEKPIGVHEFLYPLMVGYDSVVLDVDCELGGSDQEFNILAGRHLQQAYGKREKFVLTTKLIEGTDGRKMSKTYNNAVYFDDTPSDMFGKLMSIKDELIKTYFEALTDVPVHEVDTIMQSPPRDSKFSLALHIVGLYHGKDVAKKAGENWVNTFSKGEVPSDIPTVRVTRGTSYLDALKSLGESNSELRRLAEAGAISEVGGAHIRDLNAEAHPKTLRIGKHRFLKIEVQ